MKENKHFTICITNLVRSNLVSVRVKCNPGIVYPRAKKHKIKDGDGTYITPFLSDIKDTNIAEAVKQAEIRAKVSLEELGMATLLQETTSVSMYVKTDDKPSEQKSSQKHSKKNYIQNTIHLLKLLLVIQSNLLSFAKLLPSGFSKKVNVFHLTEYFVSC